MHRLSRPVLPAIPPHRSSDRCARSSSLTGCFRSTEDRSILHICAGQTAVEPHEFCSIEWHACCRQDHQSQPFTGLCHSKHQWTETPIRCGDSEDTLWPTARGKSTLRPTPNITDDVKRQVVFHRLWHHTACPIVFDRHSSINCIVVLQVPVCV
eukprot:SAG31_NODE_1043_length_10184_cov_2.174517_6_plen_154_part_00